jgi:glutaminase
MGQSGVSDGPPTSPVLARLRRLHERFADLDGGEVATYIPELARADARSFGICVVTVDGAVYEVGDTAAPFTIQSISKPFVFSLALSRLGRDRVYERIGVEPTGEAFNSITLDEITNRPYNPMVNAGAIAATDLIGKFGDRSGAIREHLSAYAGRRLEVDRAVYASERDTGNRNRAIAYLMRNFDMIEDVEESLDAYFEQCSLLVDARTLGSMAATLANGGVRPADGERVVDADVTGDVLSVMATCGMYDASGEWIYRVGIPAKSGVSGGIIGVLPGQAGIAVYSPPLDPRGNSVRGLAVFQELSGTLGMHLFRGRMAPASPIRRVRDGRASGSRRMRSPRDHAVLDDVGVQLATLELQGPLGFGTTERIAREVVVAAAHASHLVLDLTRVTDVDPYAAVLLWDLVRGGSIGEATVVLVGASASLQEALAVAGVDPWPHGPRRFTSLDEALEWCEDELLAAAIEPSLRAFDLTAVELFQDLPRSALDAVVDAAARLHIPDGTVLARQGDPAHHLFVIERGVVEITLEVGGALPRRLRTQGAGSTIGEASLLGSTTRSATMQAAGDVVVHRIPAVSLLALCERDPSAGVVLYRNLSQIIDARLRRTNRYHDET